MTIRRLVVSLGCLIACTALSPAAYASITLYKAHRPGLRVALWVGPNRIVRTHVLALMRCGDGSKGWGGVEIHGWTGFSVHPNGHFKLVEDEAYEGSGFYYERLAGQVNGNTIKGSYRAWEERLGEEDVGWLPRCGTVVPRGRNMTFVAHRVSGPAWRHATEKGRLRNRRPAS